MCCINSSDGTDSSESRAQENNENPVIKNDEVKKVCSHRTPAGAARSAISHRAPLNEISSSPSQVEPSQNATPKAETEASPVKRRGRPPKTAAAAGAAAEKEGTATPTGGAGRGRKRAADSSAAESVNSKLSKQQQNDEGSKRQIDLQR